MKISEISCLVIQVWKSIPSRRVYILRKTPYEILIKSDEFIWINSIHGNQVSFEEVFKNSPPDIKKELSFHLDLFNS